MSTARLLKGHKAAVTSIQVNADLSCLVSASEDGTVRIWDLQNERTKKCITGCFSEDIENVRIGAARGSIYVACTKNLYLFDAGCEGIIVREAKGQIGLSDGGDEVSNIAVNIKGDMLAVAMDSGVINLIPLKPDGQFCENAGSTRYRRLTRVHTNIVSTVTFKRNNPRELLSGSFDYSACIWEADRGKPKSSTKFTMLAADDQDGKNDGGVPRQMVNPPFVMAVEYVLGGRCIVAALGDGTVRILNVKDLTLNTVIEAHHCMITALYADDCHIVTGGTDSMIRAYQLVIVEPPQSNANAPAGTAKKKASPPQPLPNLVLQAVPLFTITHDEKINALACVFDTIAGEASAARDTRKEGGTITDASSPSTTAPVTAVPAADSDVQAEDAAGLPQPQLPLPVPPPLPAVQQPPSIAGTESREPPAVPSKPPAHADNAVECTDSTRTERAAGKGCTNSTSSTGEGKVPVERCRCYVGDAKHGDIAVYTETFPLLR